MKKSLITGALIFSLLATPVASFAQTTDETTSTDTTVTTVPLKKPAGLFRTAALTNLKEEVRMKREEAIQEMKTAREDFKAKLEALKDTRKKEIVDRIDTRISNANQRYTTTMADNLEKLSSILDRISSKAASLKSEGKDTTALEAAITDAQNKIDSAQTAVTTQAGKDYVLTIEDDTSLGQTISPVVTQFREDLQTTHKTVMDAKQAVVKAAVELRKLTGTI